MARVLLPEPESPVSQNYATTMTVFTPAPFNGYTVFDRMKFR